MRTRAYRRHQHERMRQRYLKLARRIWGIGVPASHLVQLLVSTHGKPCSCWCCGHHRANWGPSVQERRAAVTVRLDEWTDIGGEA